MPVKEDQDYIKTFVFFADLLSYSMRKAGLEWIMPDLEKDPDLLKYKRFLPVIGDAVWLYREKYNDYLKEDIENNFRNSPSTTVVGFVLNFAEKTFAGKNFVKEFFMFSAFMVNATFNFSLSNEEDLIDMLLLSTEEIYDIFMRRRFRALGGWHILQRHAIRCFIYGI